MTEHESDIAEAMARIQAAHKRFWADLSEFLTDDAIAKLRETENEATARLLDGGHGAFREARR